MLNNVERHTAFTTFRSGIMIALLVKDDDALSTGMSSVIVIPLSHSNNGVSFRSPVRIVFGRIEFFAFA